MTTFKDVLCVLAIFIAYSIAGRLDYQDAVRLEQIRQERLHAECLTATPADSKALINDLPFDPSLSRTVRGAPDDGHPCTPHAR